MQLADDTVAGKEEEIADAQILGAFPCPENKIIRKSESMKVISSEATYLFLLTLKLIFKLGAVAKAS